MSITVYAIVQADHYLIYPTRLYKFRRLKQNVFYRYSRSSGREIKLRATNS